MTTENSKLITIGRLGDACGIKGWLHLISYASPPENIFSYNALTIKQNLLIQIEAYKSHGNHFVVQLKNCDDRDQALAFKHQDIFIDRHELPQPQQNEYYWSDLIGLTIYNTNNEVLGVIDHLFETGSNDVIVATHKTKKHLIPYLKSVVKEIDLKKKRMMVDWEL